MSSIKGLLIDLDGTIYNDTVPIPGSLATIKWLHEIGIPFRFITNTTMKSRETLQKKLASMGIVCIREDIFSAAYAGSLYVRQKPDANCYLLILEDAKKEYVGLEKPGEVDFVVVGDLGKEADFDKLNAAFRHLLHGAELVALQKNRFWLSDDGYMMDAGAFVAMLEYAANTTATLIGKPAPTFFEMALRDMGLSADEVLMIGDDIESDIGGAQRMGMRTCLVRTGKFRQKDFDNSKIKPDYILPSFFDLADSEIAELLSAHS